MRESKAYKKARQYVIDNNITEQQVRNVTISQIRNLFELNNLTDNFIEALRGALLGDFTEEDLVSNKTFVLNALKVRWPNIVIERGDCRDKPMFEVWPLGKPE